MNSKMKILVLLSLASTLVTSWLLSTVYIPTMVIHERTFEYKLSTSISNIPTPSRSIKILIVTRFRSGSSFVANLFSHHPGVFYVFEPFLLNKSISFNAEKAAEILLDIHNCSFDSIRHRSSNRSSKMWLSRVFCTNKHGLIEDKQNNAKIKCGHQIKKNSTWIHSVCKEYKHIVIKTIRIFDVGILMKLQDKGIKILHLVRDPRGRVNSITKLFKRNYTNKLIKEACSKQERFLFTIKEQLKKFNPLFRQNYFLVRYEDISRNPLQMTKRMYSALGLDLRPEVSDWITKSTVLNKGGSMSTTRNSSAVWNLWRAELGWSKIRYLQSHCHSIFRQLGYSLIDSKQDLSTASVLSDFPTDSVLHENYLV